MTKLLEQAIETVKRLPEAEQNAIARDMLERAGQASELSQSRVQAAEDFVRSLRSLAAEAKPPPTDWAFRREEAYEERLGRWK